MAKKNPSVMEQLQARKPMSPIEQAAKAAASAEVQSVLSGEKLPLEQAQARARPSARLAAEPKEAQKQKSSKQSTDKL